MDSGVRWNCTGDVRPVLDWPAVGTAFCRRCSPAWGVFVDQCREETDVETSKVDEILEFSELQEFSNMKLKNYSSGMRARLAFSTAIQINPDIMLIDEILSVGDHAFRMKSYKLFYSFRKNKKTILYVSHNLESLSKLCDRVLFLHHGKNVMLGNPKEVIEKYKEVTSKKDSTN